WRWSRRRWRGRVLWWWMGRRLPALTSRRWRPLQPNQPPAPATDYTAPPPSGTRSSRSDPRQNAVLETLAERIQLPHRRVGRSLMKKPDHRHRLLRAPRERPRRRSAAKKRDERASPDHSITSSARASSAGGTSRPSALAVLRFTTISKLVGNCTGRS